MIEVVIEANKLTSKKLLKIKETPLAFLIVGGIDEGGCLMVNREQWIAISQIYAQKHSKKNPY